MKRYVDAKNPAKSPTTPPPKAIISDFLDKFILIQYLILSHNEFIAGMAEVIKYSIIYDYDFLDYLINNSRLYF